MNKKFSGVESTFHKKSTRRTVIQKDIVLQFHLNQLKLSSLWQCNTFPYNLLNVVKLSANSFGKLNSFLQRKCNEHCRHKHLKTIIFAGLKLQPLWSLPLSKFLHFHMN